MCRTKFSRHGHLPAVPAFRAAIAGSEIDGGAGSSAIGAFQNRKDCNEHNSQRNDDHKSNQKGRGGESTRRDHIVSIS